MEINKELMECQCIGFIPEDIILKYSGFKLDASGTYVEGCESKVVVDIGAGFSSLSRRFLNCKKISAIDPMYFVDENNLGRNGLKGTLRVVNETLTLLKNALDNNEEIASRIDFYGMLDFYCTSLKKYKEAIGRIIAGYESRRSYLYEAESVIKDIEKYPSTDHIPDNSVDIVFINALLFDCEAPIDILTEANRIISSEKGEIIIVDYKNLGQNKLYDKALRAGIRISGSDNKYFCIKLKKGDFRNLCLWRDYGDYAYSEDEIIKNKTKIPKKHKICFGGREVSQFQRVNDKYLNNIISDNLIDETKKRKSSEESEKQNRFISEDIVLSLEEFQNNRTDFLKTQKEFGEVLLNSRELLQKSKLISILHRDIQESEAQMYISGE